jgi:hypothetical protein
VYVHFSAHWQTWLIQAGRDPQPISKGRVVSPLGIHVLKNRADYADLI